MLSSTSEQPRRLNLKIAYALFVVVQQTVTKLLHYLLIGFFQSLKWKPVKHGGPITSLINLVYAKKEKKKNLSSHLEKRRKKKRRLWLTSFSSLLLFLLASTLALCMLWSSPKSHLSRSWISCCSSSVISWWRWRWWRPGVYNLSNTLMCVVLHSE